MVASLAGIPNAAQHGIPVAIYLFAGLLAVCAALVTPCVRLLSRTPRARWYRDAVIVQTIYIVFSGLTLFGGVVYLPIVLVNLVAMFCLVAFRVNPDVVV